MSVCTGLLCGAVGTLFHILLDGAKQVNHQYPWLLYGLPLGGIATVALYRVWGVKKDRGTNLVLLSIRAGEKLPANMAPLMFISTLLTHLFGGSAGREGAALQIGGSIGTMLGRFFDLDESDLKVMTMCGMSALFSALFGTPVTASIFSMEVISVGIMHYSAFLPCIISALIASSIAQFCGVTPECFPLSSLPPLTLSFWLKTVLLAAACALLSILFILALHNTGLLYRKLFKNQYLRAAVGGVAVVTVTLLIGNRDYNGAGMEVVARAIGGEAVPYAFVLKILLTALTLGAGFKGGEIVPTFFVGATFGCTVGGLLGMDPGFGAALGLIAMFCGVVNCPITALILSAELFGLAHIAVFALTCAVSYMLSGRYGLYSGQGLVYSKIRNEYINSTARG